MRNIAVNFTTSEYIYSTDIDFMCQPDLYSIAKKRVQDGDMPPNSVGHLSLCKTKRPRNYLFISVLKIQ